MPAHTMCRCTFAPVIGENSKVELKEFRKHIIEEALQR
jgi:hypothetical protein